MEWIPLDTRNLPKKETVFNFWHSYWKCCIAGKITKSISKDEICVREKTNTTEWPIHAFTYYSEPEPPKEK